MPKELFYHVPVTAGGASYDLSRDLTSFTIEEDEQMADVLKIHVTDRNKVLSHAFQEGMDVEVDLGMTDDHSLVFRGRIYKVDADMPEDGVPRLVIHAHDNSMKMGLLKRKRAWQDKTLKEIVTEIAADPKYSFKQKEIKLRGDPCFDGNGLRQDNKTDLEFVLELASDYGAIMYIAADDKGDNFHFLSQYHVMEEITPALTLYYGRCDVPGRLLSFRANSDVGNIRLPRLLSGMDYTTGKRIQPKDQKIEEVVQPVDRFRDENLTEFGKREPAKAEQLKAMMTAAADIQTKVREERGAVDHVADPVFTTEERIKERAKNQHSTSLLGMEANGTTTGNHRLHAQTTVEIADAGRFSGKWFLSKVQHTVDSQGYHTSFECRR
jgi:uncharacterized protein